MSEQTQTQSWTSALKWGIGIALIHRLVLLLWMALVWLLVGQNLNIPVHLHVDPVANLPTLESPLEQIVFGVWRRWDASHYLNLAQNGYRLENPGPTVFAPLAPLGIRLFDTLVPGKVDAGALVFATLAFALALTMLYRLCQTYYADENLGRWAVITLAILPHAFFFDAPMSEGIYMVFVLAALFFAARTQWIAAAVCVAFATLARSQGIAIAGVLLLMMLQHCRTQHLSLPQTAVYIVKNGWSLLLIPLATLGFLVYRSSIGLPSLTDTYLQYSYNYFADPLTGFLNNITWLLRNPGQNILDADIWALFISLVLLAALLRNPTHRRWPMIAYTAGFILIFLSRISWVWGTYTEVRSTQSFARYALTLFPLTIWLADWLRRLRTPWRLVMLTSSICGLLAFSALFALGGGAP